jgi:hypothetical protein
MKTNDVKTSGAVAPSSIPLPNVKEHLPPRSGSKNKQDASGG